MPNTLRGFKREGEIRIRATGGFPIIEEVYTFLVDADSKDTSRFEVFNSTPNIPIPNVTVSSYGITVCKDVALVRDDKIATLWHGTANFSSEVEENQNGSNDQQSNPETWVPIYETKFERLQEVATKDQVGKAISNSAGQPFDNGIIRARFIPVWEFFQIEPASVTDEQVIDRNEVVNIGAFKGRAARTLLCTVLSSVVGFYYGAPRRLTKYSLKYNSQNWRHKRLDVGTVFLDANGEGACGAGGYSPYTDCEGNVMLGGLDGSGAKVAPGTEPSVLEFSMYPEVNFSTFLRT
jgi:hypothetical protein